MCAEMRVVSVPPKLKLSRGSRRRRRPGEVIIARCRRRTRGRPCLAGEQEEEETRGHRVSSPEAELKKKKKSKKRIAL